ncbi:hypothetical protein ACFL40_03330 [candidate division KSB1 bacterium]
MKIHGNLKTYYPILIILMFTFTVALPDVYIPFLRDSYAERFPEKWDKEPNNGKYNSLVVIGPGTISWATDEGCIAGKIMEYVRNGRPYDVYGKEYKYSLFWIQDIVAYSILAAIQIVTQNIMFTWIIAKLLFSFLWLLFVFLICRQFKLPVSYSVLCSVVSFFFGNVFGAAYYYFPDLYIVIVKTINSFFSIDFTVPVSFYTRIVNPLMSYTFIFIAFFIFLKIFIPEKADSSKKVNYIKSVLYGIFIGSLIYVHPFEWSFTFAVLFFVILILWFYGLKNSSLKIIISLLTSLIVSLPLLLIQLLDKTTFENYPAVPNRVPDYKSIVFLAIIFAILYLYQKKKLLNFQEFVLFLSIGTASFSLMNHHVILGKAVSIEHYVIIAGCFNTFILLIILGKYLQRKLSSINLSQFSFFLLLLSLVLIINKGLIYSQNNYKVMGLPKSYEKAFEWLKSNTPKNSVIGTLNVEFVHLLPIYSNNISYVAHIGTPLTRITSNENAKRYMDLMEIIKIDKEKLKNTLRFWDDEYIGRIDTQRLHKFMLNQEVDRNSYEISQFEIIVIGFIATNFNNSLEIEQYSKIMEDKIFNNDRNLVNSKVPEFELSYLIVEPWARQFITQKLDYPLLYDSDGIQIYKFEKVSFSN